MTTPNPSFLPIPSLNYTYPEIFLPSHLNQSSYFESYIKTLPLSTVYDAIEKRFEWYHNVMKSQFFTYENATTFYPIRLFHKDIPFEDCFPNESDIPFDYVSFYFFRIFFSNSILHLSFSQVHELFVYLETTLFLIHLQSYPHRISLLLQNQKITTSEDNLFYYIPFDKVMPMVTSRRYQMKNGLLRVPRSESDIVLSCLFFSILQNDKFLNVQMPKELEPLKRLINQKMNLFTLRSPCELTSFGCGSKLTAQTLNENLRVLPLCMYNIIFNMKKKRNVMFDSRHQIGIFFYHFQLPQQQLALFLTTYMKEKFDKEPQLYYYFRHCYGLEGSKITEPVWSCLNVRSKEVGLNQFHGCPFDLIKHNERDLKEILVNYLKDWEKVPPHYDIEDIDKYFPTEQGKTINTILDYSRHLCCEKACETLFQFITSTSVEITHPNLYSYLIYPFVFPTQINQQPN
ncbi:hypothetical protein ENUP19_0266G0035 [Entamoeba nuttalli]|uniref:DNA primase large subunit, putative n=2 Tax=Entamoeba nuttalli TaxID=412467 RepID=K2H273_ENTNP|nr:DNA primase large subunit, putative [Entamoeba nuttalli P19]EKE40397.1 DNA primase large subunit, putative [Entamoeba nuttalli P19]|eukprot:XP_008857255.1 DNA primase large subunit, putative [Entamoeba nuttalli P19]